MSLEDRLRHGLPSIVDGVRDPDASAERVRASSRMRARRRRTFAVTGALVLAIGGVVLAADRDDDPETRVAGVTVTAPAPGAAAGVASGASGSSGSLGSDEPPPATTASSPTVPPTTTTTANDPWVIYSCGVPLIPTVLPEGVRPRLVPNALAVMELRGADRWVVLAPSLNPPAASAGARTVELPALATRAAVGPTADGATLAEFTIDAPAGCASHIRVFTGGVTAAETDRVLLGLRPQSACSAVSGLGADPGPGELPAPVAATRVALRAAAASCDFKALTALAAANPAFVAEVTDVRREDQWRVDEGVGRPVMRTIAALLDQAPRRVEAGITAGGPSYVWPASAGDPSVPLGDPATAAPDGRDLFVEIRADGALAAIRTR